MKNKFLSVLLLMCVLASVCSTNSFAAESFTYQVNATTLTPSVGSEFDVSVSLLNYASATAGIRGIQIDITNIDTSIFEVISHSSTVSDTSAASNKTSYSSANNRIRYVYANMSGTLDKSVTQMMTLRLKVKSSITVSGSISLPVTVKIQATDGTSTQNSTLTINYTSTLIDVNVEWGSMKFTYSDETLGEWNPSEHTYEGGTPAGWTCADDANKITVTSNSNVSVNVTYAYSQGSDYSSIGGGFVNSGNAVISSPVTLAAGDVTAQTTVAYLKLTGTPANEIKSFSTIGSVSITIGVN